MATFARRRTWTFGFDWSVTTRLVSLPRCAQPWLAWLEPRAAYREFSFGQQRLVLIARAAIKVPPLVVMDEPSSGLDQGNRARAFQLVESLCAEQKSTVLMVTHRADERDFWQERIGGAILSLPLYG